ncbi:DNA sulfur modification protein DndD [Leptolyngbya iicbica]|uniref:Nuclease SbcCD subunit C n=2 Tax=Cyanophyceae TaxID=3028117 RepID=A0A4Q7E992_9CYAN|nr:DNA sulfur modification protein DndD [Leptolyngbya sp. LK]RZM79138.1 DNA sulfur modification protein DndD [Leptolyngbya sp. LK]
MIFLELVLQNFGPYHGRHCIDLRPTPDRPIILIGGLNGGGKTTLMDALRLVLYGQRAPIDRRRNLAYADFLAQCVNTQAAPDAEAAIELEFERVLYISGIEKLGKIRVIRTWQRGTKDDLTIELDGWPNEILTQNWDEQVEDWLPVGLSNLFLFDGEQVKELAEQDTPPPNVINAIRSVLGLELVDRLAQDLTVLVSRKKAELGDEETQQAFQALSRQIEQVEIDLQAEANSLKACQDSLDEAETALQAAEDHFFAGGGHITEQITPLKEQRNADHTEIGIQTQVLQDLTASALPLALVQDLLTQAAQQGQHEQAQQQAAIARDALTDHDQRLLEVLDQLQLKPTQKKTIQAFLDQEAETLSTHASGEAWLQTSDDALTQLNHILNHQLTAEQQLAQSHLTHIQTLSDRIDAIENKLAKAASPEDYERLKSEREQARLHLDECQLTLELHRRRHVELQRERETLRKRLTEYGAEAIAASKDHVLLTTAPRVQKTLVEFRQRLTKQKLGELEQAITQYFLLLLHKSSLVHRVMVDADTFRLDLYDTEGEPLPIQRLSAGEKQLLAIAFLWGLANVSGRQLPVAIDTPLGRLDSKHRHLIVDQYFPQASHQVILLSTDTEIRDEEVKRLKEQGAIAKEYLLDYDPQSRQTEVKEGYFW